MSDDTSILDARRTTLVAEISKAERRYFCYARINYYSAQTLLIASVVGGVLATLMGLVPTSIVEIEKWHVGVVSGLSVAFTTISRYALFQQKANWMGFTPCGGGCNTNFPRS